MILLIQGRVMGVGWYLVLYMNHSLPPPHVDGSTVRIETVKVKCGGGGVCTPSECSLGCKMQKRKKERKNKNNEAIIISSPTKETGTRARGG